MKSLKYAIVTFLILLSIQVNGQATPNEVTNSFLNTLKIIDLPEGKEVMKELVFRDNISFPIISSYEVVFEGDIITDLENIRGYKKLVLIKGANKNGTAIEKRYIIICYQDLVENTWKVFEFRESLNLINEMNATQNDIDHPRSTDPRKPQYKYRNLAYWQIMNGKLYTALKSYDTAFIEAKKSNDSNYTAEHFKILNRIIPEESKD
jgi:hypothetical protein